MIGAIILLRLVFIIILYTKKRGSKLSCLSRVLRPSHCLLPRISNVEAHAVMKYYSKKRYTMYIIPMDVGHRVIVRKAI